MPTIQKDGPAGSPRVPIIALQRATRAKRPTTQKSTPIKRAATTKGTRSAKSSTAARPRASHPTARTFDWRIWLILAVSLIALAASLLNLALIVGAISIPIPGLRVSAESGLAETATYGFEADANGWTARGTATSVVSNDLHVFAGRGALEFQVVNLSADQKAFVYVTQPTHAKPGTRVVAHVYVPPSAPQLIATIYILDGTWAWHSAQYPTLDPGQWTAITYQIPQGTPTSIRELGVMVVGINGTPPYTGPLYLDSVDLQN